MGTILENHTLHIIYEDKTSEQLRGVMIQVNETESVLQVKTANNMNTFLEAKTLKNGTEAAIVGNTVLCVGDSCTTHWVGNGEMRVLSFHWYYDQPIRVIRLRDSAQFYMQPSDLVAYT
jgi:hypothetical protein